MNRQPIEINGIVKDLAHLRPHIWDYVIPEKDGKPAQPYRILITFSCHCFTKGYKDEHDNSLIVVEKGERRTFCEDRYTRSFDLLGHVKAMGPANVFINHKKGQRQNYMRVPVPTGNYEIYFKLSRASKKGIDLNLYVQSAFLRTTGQSRKLGKIRFAVVVHNTHHNKPINPPPRHRK